MTSTAFFLSSSAANVREMLTAAMPLKQLTEEQSVELMVKHPLNRFRSTAIRLKFQRRKQKERPK